MYTIKNVNLDTGERETVGKCKSEAEARITIGVMRSKRVKGDPWVQGIVREH